jgi:hypothetical protein
MPQEVAFALGAFFRAGSGSAVNPTSCGLSHGDVAPWNLLRTSTGWVLIDWEDAREAQTPFYDLMHFLVQSCALLGRPSKRQLIAGLLSRKNWIGAAVAAYAAGARIPVEDGRPHLLTYLKSSIDQVDACTSDGRKGLRTRRQLLDALAHYEHVRARSGCA